VLQAGLTHALAVTGAAEAVAGAPEEPMRPEVLAAAK